MGATPDPNPISPCREGYATFAIRYRRLVRVKFTAKRTHGELDNQHRSTSWADDTLVIRLWKVIRLGEEEAYSVSPTLSTYRGFDRQCYRVRYIGRARYGTLKLSVRV